MYSVSFKECINCWVLTSKSSIEYSRMFCSTLGEDIVAEGLCYLLIEDALFLEQGECIGIEDFCPLVTVVTSRVASCHDV